MEQRGSKNVAEYAFGKVSENSGNRNKDAFRSLVRSFPSMLQKNGLGAAVAFLYAKNENNNPQSILYRIIEEWLAEKEIIENPRCAEGKFEKEKELMNQIVDMDSMTYRIAANETMEVCLWVKRFAEGMIH